VSVRVGERLLLSGGIPGETVRMSARTVFAKDESPLPCRSSKRRTIRSGCRQRETEGTPGVLSLSREVLTNDH
jgi:hypothetical protein